MFAWSGSSEPRQPILDQVQGPTFVLEHNNTQNNANASTRYGVTTTATSAATSSASTWLPCRIRRHVDRRTFLISTAAAGSPRGRRVSPGRPPAVELGLDRRQRQRQQLHAGPISRPSQLDQADVGDDLAPAGGARRRGGRSAVKAHADRLGIKLQLAHGSVCPSSRSFNAQTGTLEVQVARALKASQIFGATCMRCILGGDPERPQIDMHIDNMITAVRGLRSRIVDSGVKLAVENHGGDLQAREMKMMVDAVGTDIMGVCLDSGNPVWMLEDPHMTLRCSAYTADQSRPRQRGLARAGRHQRPLGQHGRGQRRHRRLDPQVRRRRSRACRLFSRISSRRGRASTRSTIRSSGTTGARCRPGNSAGFSRSPKGHAEARDAAAGGKTAGQQKIEDLDTCVRYTRELLRRL